MYYGCLDCKYGSCRTLAAFCSSQETSSLWQSYCSLNFGTALNSRLSSSCLEWVSRVMFLCRKNSGFPSKFCWSLSGNLWLVRCHQSFPLLPTKSFPVMPNTSGGGWIIKLGSSGIQLLSWSVVESRVSFRIWIVQLFLITCVQFFRCFHNPGRLVQYQLHVGN